MAAIHDFTGKDGDTTTLIMPGIIIPEAQANMGSG